MVNYNEDYYRWIQETAEKLRARRIREIDLDELIEEVEDIGRNDKRKLISQAINLISHLLKCQYQPEMHTRSWDITINNCREEIEDLLRDSPSLNGVLLENGGLIYNRARKHAEVETGLNCFPARLEWTWEQIFDEDFLPE